REEGAAVRELEDRVSASFLVELEGVVLPLARSRSAGRAAERVEPVQRVVLFFGAPAEDAGPGKQSLLARLLDVVDDGEESVQVAAEVERARRFLLARMRRA